MIAGRLSRHRWHLAFAAVSLALVALGMGFRAWGLTAKPLWLDEGYSAYAAAKGFDFLWEVVPRYETHPPFYYSVLRSWTLCFGDSILALRSLGLVCGTAAIGFGVLAARELGKFLKLEGNDRLILTCAAAMTLALMSLPVEMSREVRPYPVIIMVYAGLLAILFRLARRMDEGRRLWGAPFILYLALMEILLWLHNMGILYAFSVGLAFLVLCLRLNWSKADWTAMFLGHVAVLILWLPALLILSEQAPTWIHSTWLDFPPGARLFWSIARLFVAPELISVLAALFLMGLAWSGLWRHTSGLRALAAISIVMAAPVILSIAISLLVAPVFLLRILAAVAVPGSLLLALGLVSVSPAKRSAGFAALAVIIVQLVIFDTGLARLPPRENWYGAVNWLHKRMQPGDVVFAYPNEGALPFRYAVRDKGYPMPTRPIPTDMPTLDGGPGSWNPTGSRGVFSLPPARLQEIADAPDASAIPTIWLMRLGPWAYDPGDHFLHALEHNRVRVGRFAAAPLEIIGLRRKDLSPVAAPQQAKP